MAKLRAVLVCPTCGEVVRRDVQDGENILDVARGCQCSCGTFDIRDDTTVDDILIDHELSVGT